MISLLAFPFFIVLPVLLTSAEAACFCSQQGTALYCGKRDGSTSLRIASCRSTVKKLIFKSQFCIAKDFRKVLPALEQISLENCSCLKCGAFDGLRSVQTRDPECKNLCPRPSPATPRPATPRPTSRPATPRPTPRPATPRPTPRPATPRPTPRPATPRPTPRPATSRPRARTTTSRSRPRTRATTTSTKWVSPFFQHTERYNSPLPQTPAPSKTNPMTFPPLVSKKSGTKREASSVTLEPPAPRRHHPESEEGGAPITVGTPARSFPPRAPRPSSARPTPAQTWFTPAPEPIPPPRTIYPPSTKMSRPENRKIHRKRIDEATIKLIIFKKCNCSAEHSLTTTTQTSQTLLESSPKKASKAGKKKKVKKQRTTKPPASSRSSRLTAASPESSVQPATASSLTQFTYGFGSGLMTIGFLAGAIALTLRLRRSRRSNAGPSRTEPNEDETIEMEEGFGREEAVQESPLL